MSGVSAPVVWAIVIVLLGAWLWHTLVDHHGHLVVLRVFRPSTVVPATRHDSQWHRAGHLRRLLVNALLCGAAILVGLAWELAPYVAVVLVAVLAVAYGFLWWMRRAGQPGSFTRNRETEGSKG